MRRRGKLLQLCPGLRACPFCGDGQCKNGEGCGSCPQDCGPCCPNGKCGPNESCNSCPQDCGPCCPNGKCGSNESCSSCPEDCGKCNQAPVGKLETVNCAEISGCAEAPDKDGPIKVNVLSDGQVVATLKAKGAHPSKSGHGFSYAPGLDLKDSQIHNIEVEAMDDQGELDGLVEGSGKALLCRNEILQAGIWTVEHIDSAGLEIAPVAGTDAGSTSLLLSHSGGLPFPNSGSVTASAQLSFTDFERLETAVCGGLDSPLYSAVVAAGGEEAALPGDGFYSCSSLELPGPEFSVSALFQALQMVNDPSPRQLELADLAAWGNGWRFDYLFDAAGSLWGSLAADRFAFKSRAAAKGCEGGLSATCAGGAWKGRKLSAPFWSTESWTERVSSSGTACPTPSPHRCFLCGSSSMANWLENII